MHRASEWERERERQGKRIRYTQRVPITLPNEKTTTTNRKKRPCKQKYRMFNLAQFFSICFSLSYVPDFFLLLRKTRKNFKINFVKKKGTIMFNRSPSIFWLLKIFTFVEFNDNDDDGEAINHSSKTHNNNHIWYDYNRTI